MKYIYIYTYITTPGRGQKTNLLIIIACSIRSAILKENPLVNQNFPLSNRHQLQGIPSGKLT